MDLSKIGDPERLSAEHDLAGFDSSELRSMIGCAGVRRTTRQTGHIEPTLSALAKR